MEKYNWPQLYPTQRLSGLFETVLRGLDRVPWIRDRIVGPEALEFSQEELSVVMPLHPKDLWIAKHAVRYARKFIAHPITEILILSPADPEIAKWVKEEGLRWIPEERYCPMSIAEIREALPDHAKNRDKWIFQQLLKLSADQFVRGENFLLLDGDTLLLKKKLFKKEEQRWIDFSHERNKLYLKAFRSLTGLKHYSRVSFVCHHLFVEKTILAELKKQIESQSGVAWFTAIVELANRPVWSERDKTVFPFNYFSEYETYANWVKLKAGGASSHYFWNHAARGYDGRTLDIDSYVENLPQAYQWASFHSYYQKKVARPDAESLF